MTTNPAGRLRSLNTKPSKDLFCALGSFNGNIRKCSSILSRDNCLLLEDLLRWNALPQNSNNMQGSAIDGQPLTGKLGARTHTSHTFVTVVRPYVLLFDMTRLTSRSLSALLGRTCAEGSVVVDTAT